MESHPQHAAIAARFAAEGVEALYHFTSVENLASIRQHGGLACKDYLESAGSWPPALPGGNELSHSLDERHGNLGRVHLSFTPYTPMAYRKKQECQLCWIRVKPEVAQAQGVLFTDTNATATDHEQAEGTAGLALVNFAAIRSQPRPWDRSGWHRPVQAEILAPERIVHEHMFDMNFVSEASRQEGLRLWVGEPPIPFRVTPELFRDSQHGSYSFPYLTTLTLTSEIVSADTIGATYVHRAGYKRSEADRVSFLANVSVLPGTTAHVEWSNGLESEESFERGGMFWHWGSVNLADLPDGPGHVTYSLGQVRWATSEFQVEG